MSGSITPTRPIEGEPNGLARTVGWVGYWLLVLVAATVALLSSGGAGPTRGLAWPIVVLATCSPFVLLLLGTPPGYRALAAYRSRLATRGGTDDGPTASSLRLGFELISALIVVLSIVGTVLFSGIESSVGLVEIGDGQPLGQHVADALGASEPATLFAVAMVGLVVGGCCWFVIWLTG